MSTHRDCSVPGWGGGYISRGREGRARGRGGYGRDVEEIGHLDSIDIWIGSGGQGRASDYEESVVFE